MVNEQITRRDALMSRAADSLVMIKRFKSLGAYPDETLCCAMDFWSSLAEASYWDAKGNILTTSGIIAYIYRCLPSVIDVKVNGSSLEITCAPIQHWHWNCKDNVKPTNNVFAQTIADCRSGFNMTARRRYDVSRLLFSFTDTIPQFQLNDDADLDVDGSVVKIAGKFSPFGYLKTKFSAWAGVGYYPVKNKDYAFSGVYACLVHVKVPIGYFKLVQTAFATVEASETAVADAIINLFYDQDKHANTLVKPVVSGDINNQAVSGLMQAVDLTPRYILANIGTKTAVKFPKIDVERNLSDTCQPMPLAQGYYDKSFVNIHNSFGVDMKAFSPELYRQLTRKPLMSLAGDDFDYLACVRKKKAVKARKK